MTQRRRGTIPQRVRLTPEVIKLIDDYQAKHQIPSFSAAAESLIRQGLQQAPAEVITPVIVSVIRQEIGRLVRLQIYNIVETGVAQRLAGATLRDMHGLHAQLASGQVKKVDPERYDKIRVAAIGASRRRLERSHVAATIREVWPELADDQPGGE
jgi:hypothetical protein